MTTEIVKVNPLEYGIEESKANELVGNLPQIIAERELLSVQYDEVVRMDIELPQTAVRANELRKLIKNNRTKGIEVWHKTTKDYFLKGGQFVDAIKRKEIAENERMENALEEIENYQAKKESERKESLRLARVEQLQPYHEFVPMGINLGELSEDEYQKIFNGAKLQMEAKLEAERKAEEERIEAERKAEEERIAKEKKDAEEREAQRLENERLKKEAEKREKEIEAERKANEKKLADERAKAKAEADRIEAENQAKLKAEREAKAKVEKELQDKKDTELKAENERKEAELKAKKESEKLAKAPIKKQLLTWVESFQIDIPSSELLNNEKAILIKDKFEAFKKWSKSEIESM